MQGKSKNRFRINFGLKSIFLLTVVCGGVFWCMTVGVGLWRDHQDRSARQSIPEYELDQSIDGRSENEKFPELITIIGNSKLKHWASVLHGAALSDNRYATSGKDGTVRFWDLDTGRASKTLLGLRVVANHAGSHYVVLQDKAIEICLLYTSPSPRDS